MYLWIPFCNQAAFGTDTHFLTCPVQAQVFQASRDTISMLKKVFQKKKGTKDTSYARIYGDITPGHELHGCHTVTSQKLMNE